jgi:hypothetical protein
MYEIVRYALITQKIILYIQFSWAFFTFKRNITQCWNKVKAAHRKNGIPFHVYGKVPVKPVHFSGEEMKLVVLRSIYAP